jgi:hypothetical protein
MNKEKFEYANHLMTNNIAPGAHEINQLLNTDISDQNLSDLLDGRELTIDDLSDGKVVQQAIIKNRPNDES